MDGTEVRILYLANGMVLHPYTDLLVIFEANPTTHPCGGGSPPSQRVRGGTTGGRVGEPPPQRGGGLTIKVLSFDQMTNRFHYIFYPIFNSKSASRHFST
jgi:hypothetical protein